MCVSAQTTVVDTVRVYNRTVRTNKTKRTESTMGTTVWATKLDPEDAPDNPYRHIYRADLQHEIDCYTAVDIDSYVDYGEYVEVTLHDGSVPEPTFLYYSDKTEDTDFEDETSKFTIWHYHSEDDKILLNISSTGEMPQHASMLCILLAPGWHEHGEYIPFLAEDHEDAIRYATPEFYDDVHGYGMQLVLDVETYGLDMTRVVVINGLNNDG